MGGGSGGHITPTIAVASEIKQQQPTAHIIYVMGRGDALSDVITGNGLFDGVQHVFSGKLRRYHGAGLLQIFDIPTTLKNIRDVFYVVIGFFQSVWLLHRLKPQVLFIKGGFVGVPVGLAAALLRIPYVTHDSDTVPGLANRIISRWAKWHAVGMPIENYSYPQDKTVETGIPIAEAFKPVTAKLQASYKESFGLPPEAQVVLVTGGGLGAQRLNLAMATISGTLLARNPDAVILHICGRGKDDEVAEAYRKNVRADELERVVLEPFVEDMHRYSGAADLIVARAGASSLAEFAMQAKACIVVPNPQLTGGHQTKNTAALEARRAVVALQDQAVTQNPELLLQQIEQLLASPQKRLELARNLHATAHADAALQLANLVMQTAKRANA